MAGKSRLLSEAVQDLAPRRKRPEEWTEHELNLIEQHYTSSTMADLRRLLPGRTANAIRNKAQLLGVRKWAHCEWSEEEFAVLREHYRSLGPEGIAGRLSGRTVSAVRVMANALGLDTERPWREDELAILRADYPLGGSAAVRARIPDRSAPAIKTAATRLGLHRVRRVGDGTSGLAWSAEELARLAVHQGLPLGQLQRFFPDRSRTAIKIARQRLRRGGR